jgi:hypothetical protein
MSYIKNNLIENHNEEVQEPLKAEFDPKTVLDYFLEGIDKKLGFNK